jgi:hypothetical protein
MKESRRKSRGNIILLFCAAIALITLLGACSGSPTSSSSASTSSATLTDKPIEVVSVTGPVPPINPGGPNIQMTLKNASTEPITALKITLALNRPYDIVFDVTLPVPFLPGSTISAEQNLIGGGFSDTVLYPLTISGTYRNGSTFSYVRQVQITPYSTPR